ncbi:phenylalanine--tRNA ligase subunit beta [Candidatus Woesearchaeota archaeon]|nr:phenylalanine--tRNA ligase subunit beta [Candidatus Woesearchaeota archaeon]
MPVIEFEKKELMKYLGKKTDETELKEKISFLGTDLEKFDETVKVEIFPNRPDMLSVQGFSRALKTFLGIEKGIKEYNVKSSGRKIIIKDSVKEVRPFTACAIVKNIKFDDEKIKEIMQMQEKLHITYGRNRKKIAIGIYPMEKIKFPITYEARSPEKIMFVPLESSREMNGKEILEKHPKGKDYAHLLKGKEKFPIFVDANKQILSMPPIINSHTVGKIDSDTKDVFIECSGFNLNYLKKALNMIVCNLADMNGEIYSLKLEYGNKKVITPELKPEKMKLEPDYINKILGLSLNKETIKRLLEKMGYNISNNDVLIPAYRTDILHPIDLIEDIAIAYGYDNFEAELPRIDTVAEEMKFEKFKREIRDFMVGNKLIEVKNFQLVSENRNELTKCLIDKVKIKNPLSEEYSRLRGWLIPSLLKNLSENTHNDYPQNIFEIGKIFKKKIDEIIENDRVAVALCNKKSNFTAVKQIFQSLMLDLDLKFEINETEHPSFIEGRVARVSVNGKDVAYIGEINPEVLQNYKIEMPVSVLELNLSELFEVM